MIPPESRATPAHWPGSKCSPNTVHWTYDTAALANGTGKALTDAGGKKWFFITADYAFGQSLQENTAKVVEASKDNPVFYVQYAHARICSTMRKAAEEELAPSDEALDALTADDVALVKLAAQYPRLVESAAQAREPHRIAFYLYDLAAAFHAFWNAGNDDSSKRVILTQDRKLSGARLYLVAQIGQVIRNGLGLLGVEAVEEM